MGKKTLKCGLDTPLKVHSGLLEQRRYGSVRLIENTRYALKVHSGLLDRRQLRRRQFPKYTFNLMDFLDAVVQDSKVSSMLDRIRPGG
jgi:hypothetical protein